MRALIWFRNDLRVEDNEALYKACQRSDQGVVAVYVLTPEQWESHDWGPAKVDFVIRSLEAMKRSLEKLNVPLLIRSVPRFDEVPNLILSMMSEYECDELFMNREYEVNERRRDNTVVDECAERGVTVHCFTDQVLIAPGAIRTKSDDYYTVFSPFRKACSRYFDEHGVPSSIPLPKKQSEMPCSSDVVPSTVDGFEPAPESVIDAWTPGENEAHRRLAEFIDECIDEYKEQRDFPGLPATSRMSPYLAVGSISSRMCMHAAIEANNGRFERGSKSTDHWISEVMWREFYRHVMVGYPRVSMHRAFREDVDRMVDWLDDEPGFQRWAQGRTGYPIVDAGIRELLQTGWMHNRVRMITAMFLTKHLLIDWRWGERFFMKHLVDADLANNNGGWQWSASTGTDAAPYFRIFNPWSQSRRFDPDGQYIRRFVSELRECRGSDLHDPESMRSVFDPALDYPEPIVEHQFARERALKAFKRDG